MYISGQAQVLFYLHSVITSTLIKWTDLEMSGLVPKEAEMLLQKEGNYAGSAKKITYSEEGGSKGEFQAEAVKIQENL